LYLSEINDFIEDGKRLNAVPTHISVYRDDSNLLFTLVLGRVDNASACNILTKATAKKVTQIKKTLKRLIDL